ncbi:histone acetyltransferase type B catalytic subunit [Rickenella mellea]|uniref:Histone acetyltransferase type B catalytic subunit n=1 Tax=Rickenella mellea TaxID=50990 RepID=A0A4Y7QKB0_9AGAM|nr:histone acetyltransferase type B catalytic subunit [Rickenella mellea]
MSDWTTNSNEALQLSLVRAPKDKELLEDENEYEGFQPTFTYPIFGEDEKVYGYQDLVIDLRLASGSLVQYLSISSSSKLTGKAASTVDDVEGTLYKFIPPDYLKNESEFLTRVERDAGTFRPIGTKIYSYKQIHHPKSASSQLIMEPPTQADEENNDVIVYEVYHATWDTPGFREYHRRMQIFILLYIEGGSYIQEDEETWEFVVLYEKRKRRDGPKTPTYHFVGYSTLFPFYCFPEMVRMRLSQFVILPPYQRLGHGSALYTAIYQYVLDQSRIAELTVEDPAEAFEDLRDRNDLRMLLHHKQFICEGFGAEPLNGMIIKTSKGKLGPPAEKGWVEKWRRDLKIAGRQFSRLIEMLILKHLSPHDAKAMRAFRLQVKERLYRFNYEILAQLEKQERLEKLEETFQSVKEDYQRILAMVR